MLIEEDERAAGRAVYRCTGDSVCFQIIMSVVTRKNYKNENTGTLASEMFSNKNH